MISVQRVAEMLAAASRASDMGGTLVRQRQHLVQAWGLAPRPQVRICAAISQNTSKAGLTCVGPVCIARGPRRTPSVGYGIKPMDVFQQPSRWKEMIFARS